VAPTLVGPQPRATPPRPEPGAGDRYRQRPLDDPFGGRVVPPPERPPAEGSLRARHEQPADAQYRSPIGLALSPDGERLYVACEDQDTVLTVDVASRSMAGSLATGRSPFRPLLSPDGARLFVSNRLDDSVEELDLATGRALRRLPAGDDPHGLALSPEGTWLYVANMGSDDISILDLASGRELRRLSGGRFPFELAAGGGRIYASSELTQPVPFRQPPELELTVIDGARGVAVERRRQPNTVIAQGLALSPDGAFLVVALESPRNLLPETQIHRGWMVTYALAVLETRPGGRQALLPLDEPELYYADPYGVAFSHDGQRLYVSHSGVDTVTVLDWPQVLRTLAVREGRIGLDAAALDRLGRSLAASAEYVQARIPVGRNPKHLVVSPDDRFVYVAERLSDSVGVIDTARLERVTGIPLGGPDEVTPLRRGAIVFHYASISFQRQLSCNTCHPENLVDGLIYDIAADGGMGRNLVDNKTLRGIAATPPFKWSGKNPNLERQEGPRAAQLFFRSHGFEPPDVAAITAYIEATPLVPNRHRSEALDEFQRRGKLLFERAWTNDGRYIPVANRCETCHPAPYYTDRLLHDVGSQAPFDDKREFDTPGLNNIFEQAPFLHDGRCWTLEEIWTEHNPFDTHGVTNDMTKEQLNDLIEYLKTL